MQWQKLTHEKTDQLFVEYGSDAVVANLLLSLLKYFTNRLSDKKRETDRQKDRERRSRVQTE